MRPYVPLTVKTNFSFLEGASHPDELVEQAASLGLPAIGLCDRNGVHGVVRAHVAAKRVGLRVLFGAELTIGEHGWLLRETKPKSKSKTKTKSETSGRAEPALPILPPTPTGRISVLAETRAGWARLCRLLSIAHGRGPKGQARLSLAELAGSAGTGVYGESANAPHFRPASEADERPGAGMIALVRDPDHLVAMVEGWGVDRVYALVSRHHRAEDLAHEDRLARVAARLGVPLVAGNEVLYHSAARRPLQDVMACIRAGTSSQRSSRRKSDMDRFPNTSSTVTLNLFEQVQLRFQGPFGHTDRSVVWQANRAAAGALRHRGQRHDGS